jgi:cyclophilin family peptidyl-prolyl cis-trans isomerase
MEWAKLGVDSIQRDEPTSTGRTAVPVAAKFFEQVHPEFRKRLGRRIPMSCNLGWNGSVLGGGGEPVTKLFDFGMAEMGPDKVRSQFFLQASRDSRQRGKAMVFTANQDLGVSKYRLSIAACYASGMTFIVPWDQYAGRSPRVFSRPEDLADLYGFVRANARFLDGYEDVAAMGFEAKDPHWGKAPALSIEGGDKVSAFVRAKPGDATAPVVVHLIDWGKPGPFKIKLRSQAFFASGGIAATLQLPVPYDARLHEKAEQSKKYAPLSRDVALRTTEQEGWTVVEIPALEPWGILVVSKKIMPKSGARNGE